MYYAAIHLENNPSPGNPIGSIISLHTNKVNAQASAVEALKAYDILTTMKPEERRSILIASVAQRFSGQTQIYGHDLLKGDVVKLSVIAYQPVSSVI